ncbi:MAG TPA: bifunctional helix-turn-helix transcriptional regulator/GNAT family N-acetyltransferase [Candidatus Acidoferrales bacterium]|nr:bifunctional helix-turn-helix transcriptional regulator/GNAT family N-acetyltransferase [Candidatus Acidoferrales bacterium]
MAAAAKPGRLGASLRSRIGAVRQFNRFYTKQIGVLREGFLDTQFSLTEGRVLQQLAQRDNLLANTIARDLELDAGYLSRILRDFVKRGLVEKMRSASDGRQSHLAITAAGRQALALLDQRANEEVGKMLRQLPAAGQGRLIDAMRTVEDLLGDSKESKLDTAAFILRSHSPGDMGWVVYRQGVLYREEYGYDEQFEALVAEIVAKYIQHEDRTCERCWIAERNGEIAGSVFLVKKSWKIAKLRLLYVEPKARGLGIGGRLISECISFARQTGYEKIQLWTQSELHDARRLYKRAGFRLIHREKHHSFSRDLIAETWELKLQPVRTRA